ncbi:MAG: hypothetical protein NC133_04580 [Prevotella sp.]|nr:hypothetical protein [Prevotella sp.]
MATSKYGAEYSEERYEFFAKALRERDLKIVELQKECEQKQEQLDELSIFANCVVLLKKLFAVMLKPQEKIG